MLHSDPLRPDSDGDALPDGFEVALGVNPLLADSDGDGAPDGLEARAGLDPTNASDGAQDSDGDGLTDAQEIRSASDRMFRDTDSDGLDDLVEVRDLGTHPGSADSDGDRIPDGVEQRNGLNPLSAGDAAQDLDGDGFTNLEESTSGSIITRAASRPAPGRWNLPFGDARAPYTANTRIDPLAIRLLWSHPPESGLASYGAPALGGDGIVVASNVATNVLHAFDSADGSSKWQRPVPRIGTPVLYRDGVYVANTTNSPARLQAYALATGNPRPGFVATVDTGHVVVVPDGDRLITNAAPRNLRSVQAATGAQVWSTELRETNFAPVYSLGARNIYVTMDSIRSAVLALDRESGRQLYALYDPAAVASANISSTLVEDDGMLYVPYGGQLTAFDVQRRRIAFRTYDEPGRWPAIFGRVIYTTTRNELRAIDATTGIVQWRWQAPEDIAFAPLITLNTAFVSGGFGSYAVDLTSHTEVWRATVGGHLTMGPDRVLYITPENGALSAFTTFADGDNDGLPDDWERGFGLDTAADDRAGDLDGDGLSNLTELRQGTAPNMADTDGDGLSDRDEVASGRALPTTPDTDSDGLDDRREIETTGTDPSAIDSDFDGLADGDEVQRYLTNPNQSDSDSDGYPDDLELQQSTDPRSNTSSPAVFSNFSLTFEDGAMPRFLRQGHDAGTGWVVSSAGARTGNRGIRTTTKTLLETAAMELRGRFAEGALEFDYRREGVTFQLEVDGRAATVTDVEQFGNEWRRYRVLLSAGLHTIRWQYIRPRSVTGDVQGSIDNVQFTATTSPNPMPTPTPDPVPAPPPTSPPKSGGGGGGGSADGLLPLLFALLGWTQLKRRRLRRQPRHTRSRNARRNAIGALTVRVCSTSPESEHALVERTHCR